MNTAPIVSKVWSFCTTLRDDGVGYGDYLEHLTYLIFLKMADEYALKNDDSAPAHRRLYAPFSSLQGRYFVFCKRTSIIKVRSGSATCAS